MADSRWHQDLEVAQLIEHLNQEDKFNQPDNLTPSEVRVILRELEHCRNDFVYAARNYFWITTKKLRNQLLTLLPAQELILEKVLEMKAKKQPQKIIIIKARQLGALDPKSRLLTVDYRWVAIEDIVIGQELVAMDEHAKGNGKKLRLATVLKKWEVKKPAFEISFDNGEKIIATEDHPFLSKIRGGVGTKWVEVKDLRVGDPIRQIAKPWEDGDKEDYWYGGLLDGEGCIRNKWRGGAEVGPSQVFNEVFDRAHRYLTDKGYTFHVEVDNRKSGTSSKIGNQPVAKLLVNRTDQIMKILGQ